MDKQKTGQVIKEARTKKGCTQAELGDILGVTNKAVSRWEKGDSFPDVGVIENLANALDISIEEIIVGSKNQVTTEAALNELLKTLKMQRRQKVRILLRALVCIIYGIIIIVAGYGIFHGPSIFPLYADFYLLIIVTMAVMVIFMMFSSRGKTSMRILSRPDLARFVASLISGVYSSFMLGWCILKIMHGVMPFGMEPMQVGPFIEKQLLAVFLLNLLIFTFDIYKSIKDGVSFSVTSYASIVVLNLEMIYEALLSELTTGDVFMYVFAKYTTIGYGALMIVLAIRYKVNGRKRL
jgi:transcriptional regulator with XRE-family HTH domain